MHRSLSTSLSQMDVKGSIQRGELDSIDTDDALQAVGRHGGVYVNATGDGLLARFDQWNAVQGSSRSAYSLAMISCPFWRPSGTASFALAKRYSCRASRPSSAPGRLGGVGRGRRSRPGRHRGCSPRSRHRRA
jgi:hypothetical protein